MPLNVYLFDSNDDHDQWPCAVHAFHEAQAVCTYEVVDLLRCLKPCACLPCWLLCCSGAVQAGLIGYGLFLFASRVEGMVYSGDLPAAYTVSGTSLPLITACVTVTDFLSFWHQASVLESFMFAAGSHRLGQPLHACSLMQGCATCAC
jgi:hypothetical protein